MLETVLLILLITRIIRIHGNLKFNLINVVSKEKPICFGAILIFTTIYNNKWTIIIITYLGICRALLSQERNFRKGEIRGNWTHGGYSFGAHITKENQLTNFWV